MSNYDTIRLEKGMYAGGKSLTHTLEALSLIHISEPTRH